MKTLYSDEDIDIMEEEVYTIPGAVFLHTNVKQFSLSKYKKIHRVWQQLRKDLASQGYFYVLCVPPSAKEEKWERLFGFEHTGTNIKGKKVMFFLL